MMARFPAAVGFLTIFPLPGRRTGKDEQALASSCVQVLLTTVQPYGQSEGGLATPFYAGSAKPAAVLALTIFTGTAWLLIAQPALPHLGGIFR